ncbi:MAG: hypothetical protein AMJ41_01865 [candidate division Zixibacteria bacterium DG_27]|nr:MAG: hypothetical protein AMJ41_01865 [candidate division Zixibacteria bacterium DG_27]
MSLTEIAVFIIALVIMLIGLAGVFLPVLPGALLIFGAALLYALLTGFEAFGARTLILLGVLTAVTYLLDWLATAFGIRKMGGSYWGIIGAFIGMAGGLLLAGVGVIGFIAGAFVGAFLMELVVNRETDRALRASLGSFIGFFVSGVGRFLIAVTMIGVFIWEVLS